MRFLVSIFLVLTSFVSYSQTLTGFTGTVTSVNSSYVGNGEYSITATDFRSSQSLYDQLDLAVGQIIYAEPRNPNSACNKYKILQISFETNGDITFLTKGSGIVGSTARPKDNDVLAIVSTTQFNNIPLFKASQNNLIGYVSPNLQECMMNDIIFNIDSIGTNSLDSFFFEQIQDTSFQFVSIFNDGSIVRDTFNLSIATNSATVNTDGSIITGNGSISDPVTADTVSILATKNDLLQSEKKWYKYDYSIGNGMTVGQNFITVPDLPTDEAYFRSIRNGVQYSTNGNLTFSGTLIFFNDYNFQNNETITIYVYR